MGKAEPTYSNVPGNNENNYVKNIQEKVESLSPLEIFLLYFTDQILDEIVKFSNKYAQDNNRHDFILTSTDLRKFLGILILSGYHRLPQQRMYWSNDPDKGLEIVRNCMSRNKFEAIKRNIHLSDNSDLDKKDKFAKLRPTFKMMNTRYLQFGIFSHNISIDEEISGDILRKCLSKINQFALASSCGAWLVQTDICFNLKRTAVLTVQKIQ